MPSLAFDEMIFTTVDAMKPKAKPYAPGDRVHVCLEGTVAEPVDLETPENKDYFFVGAPADRGALYLKDREVRANYVIRKAAPKWRNGDVIRFRHKATMRPITLSRGETNWPDTGKLGAFVRDDSEIDAMWNEGRVTHLMRDGRPVKA